MNGEETEIMSADGGNLVLTSYRLQYWHSGSYQTIKLKDITYIGFKERRYPKVLLWFSLAALVASFPVGRTDVAFSIFALIFLAGLFVYMFTGKKMIRFASSGGAIDIDARPIGDSAIEQFISLTETAIFEVNNQDIQT